MSQQKDLAVLPAYIISLGFVFELRGRGHGVFWPGVSMALAALLGIAAIALHKHIYGPEALALFTAKVTFETKHSLVNTSSTKLSEEKTAVRPAPSLHAV